MAKMKKRKLRWKASESKQVVGYRLYWAEDGAVGYDSPFVALGNVTEVILPDEVEGFLPKGGPIDFGIAAVDELGNESDLTTFKAPYQFNIPLAPEGLWIESLGENHSKGKESNAEKPPELVTLFEAGGDSKAEKEPSVAPSELNDEVMSYASTQLYGYPKDE